MIPINNNISPFTFYCQKVIPLVFDDSLSYYETLCALRDYVNNLTTNLNVNSSAIVELQGLYVQLQKYVEDYFSDLNVQSQVNTKLDAMVLDGTLANIINDDIFNTLNTEIAGINTHLGTVDTSITGINNNLVTVSTDIANIKLDIIDINNTMDTVNQHLGSVEGDVANLNNEITNMKYERYIFVGDSYNEGAYASDNKGWGLHLKDLLGLDSSDYYNVYEGGTGFVATNTTTGHNFKTMLQAYLPNVVNKTTIDKIIVCGGYNDKDSSEEAINSAISEFITYCKLEYVNAKVYIGMIGNNAAISDAGRGIRYNLISKVMPAYKNCDEYKGIYLDGVEFSSHDYTLFYGDNVHLTNYKYIAKSIFNIINGKGANVYHKSEAVEIPVTGLPGFTLFQSMNNNNVTIQGNINRITGINFNWLQYAEITNLAVFKYLRSRFSDQSIKIPVDFTIVYSGGTVTDIGYIEISKNNALTLIVKNNYTGVTNLTIGSFSMTLDANVW